MCLDAVPLRRDAAVIGLDFGGTKIDVALADGDGVVLERLRLPMLADEVPERAMGRAVAAARELVAVAAERYDRRVAGYGAVTPGLPLDDGVALAPNLPGWERLPFNRVLAERLGTDRIAVANDVRAGALAELRLGVLRGVDPALYVSVGTGLAAALIAGGRVVHGAHGIAGEIGYSALDLTSAPAPGAAPLEEIVGGRALGQTAMRVLGEPLDAAALFLRTDAVASQIVDRALATLGGALANLALLVDPARIALGGGLMADAARILPAIRDRLVSIDGRVAAPEVVTARFVQDASLHGALALALDVAAGGREIVQSVTGEGKSQ